MASTISSSAIALLIAAFPTLARGHAYLAYPESRNLVAHFEEGFNCAHCLQSGGPKAVKDKANGIWPTRLEPGSHGLCGNPWQHEEEASFENQRFMKPTEVQATLTAGGFVDILVAVNAHHKGHFEFRICNQVLSPENFASETEGQACLDQFVLERAELPNDCTVNDERDNCVPLDPKHPERWYLPPAKGAVQMAGEDWSDEMVDTDKLPAATELRSIRYKVPAGLSCQRCTMQWYWSSANTCLYDADYLSYFKDLHRKGWSEVETWAPHVLQSWATADNTVCSSTRFGEEFWNCADISVVASDAPMQPTPNPPIQQDTPMPTAIVTPKPAPQPESEAEPEPAPATPAPQNSGESEACRSVWEQCGGVDWTGATCCEGENLCQRQDQWYSQCTPPSQNMHSTPNPPTQQDTPMPPAAVTPEHPSQPEPESEPEPAPATPAPQHRGESEAGESEACGSVWEQCGGVDWTGATCCQGDHFCRRQDEWYSQCIPTSQSLLQGVIAQSRPRRLKIHRRNANDQLLFQQGSLLTHDESEL